MLLIVLLPAISLSDSSNDYLSTIDYGIYQNVGRVSEVEAKNSTSGTVILCESSKLIKKITEIPAKIGVIFGYRGVFRDRLKGKNVQIKYKISYIWSQIASR